MGFPNNLTFDVHNLLYCFDKNAEFYEKCGFEKKGSYFAKYYI